MTIDKVVTENFTMDYVKFGSGSPLVILPGISGAPITDSAQAIANAYAQFADTRTVYVLDRIQNLPDGYSVQNMANDTAQAMQVLGISNADVFGASQGGMIALCLAINYPQLVGKLAVCSTLSRPNDISTATFTTWVQLAKQGDVVCLNKDMFGRIYSAQYLTTYKQAFDKLQSSGGNAELSKIQILSQACIDFNVYDQLDKISCPTLVVGSTDDKVLGTVGSRQIADKLHCKLVLHDSSHALYDELSDFVDMLYQFFINEKDLQN